MKQKPKTKSFNLLNNKSQVYQMNNECEFKNFDYFNTCERNKENSD